MDERPESSVRTSPGVDRAGRITGFGRLIILAFGLAGVAIGFALVPPDRAEPLVIGLMALLAIVGVVALFGGAVGLVQFGARRGGHDIARDYLDSVDDGVVLVDAANRIRYLNRAYTELTAVAEATAARPVDLAFSGSPPSSEAMYRIAQKLRAGQSATEEVQASFGDRGEGWFRVRAWPVGADGKLTAWSVSDITSELMRRESVFKDLQHAIDYLDHAPVGFFSAEPDGRIVYLNATLAEWLGIDIAVFEAGSLSLADIVLGDYGTLLTGPGEADRTETIDLDLIKRNGQSLPVRLLHRVPLTDDGAPGATRTIVLGRSAEETMTGESEALRASEVRFARFFNSAPIAIAALDGDGHIGRTNAQFTSLFGREPEARRKLIDLIAEGDRPAISGVLDAAQRGTALIAPVDVSLAADAERSIRFYINPIAESDSAEAVMVNAIDITEQKALEQQFAQSQKMETVGKLAGGIAHDFNNVLTAIIGFSDLLLANHQPSDPSFQDIMNIKQNANRAAGLVRQLLAFSRRQTLRPQVLQLGDLLSDITILINRLLGENVRLEVVHGRDLWPIKADLNQLEQVIVNLAVNARDAMPGGGQLTVRTANLPADRVKTFAYHPLPEEDYVLLEVEDTGTGMPPDVQARIFEPFFSTKDVGKGTGLGLSTVYGIVKQTGAFIYLDSEMGKGTTFRVFIPRYVQTEAEIEEAAAEPAAPEIADLTGSAKILLVEDEEAVRAFAARALASRGYEVYEASTGVEALDVMEEAGGEIDLVVSDVVMPELDGPSLLRELRKTRPELKIIFVSGYAQEAFSKNLPEGEEFRFLPKPFSLKELAVAVKETLGR